MPVNKGRLRIAVAALRSGLYLKGPGYLHSLKESPEGLTDNEGGELRQASPDAYPGWWCCLGVLGDVAIRFGLILDRGETNAGTCEFIGGSEAYLAKQVAEWYGFGPEDLTGNGNDLFLIHADGSRVRASLWNDADGSTFEDIAQGFERAFLSED